MTWRLAKSGIFTAANEWRFHRMINGGTTIIRRYEDKGENFTYLTLGDERGHVRKMRVSKPDSSPAEPSQELWEQLHDPEITKLSGRLTFPWGIKYFILFAQVNQHEFGFVGYSAPKDLWFDAELDAAANFPDLKAKILQNKREAYEKETGLLPFQHKITRHR